MTQNELVKSFNEAVTTKDSTAFFKVVHPFITDAIGKFNVSKNDFDDVYQDVCLKLFERIAEGKTCEKNQSFFIFNIFSLVERAAKRVKSETPETENIRSLNLSYMPNLSSSVENEELRTKLEKAVSRLTDAEKTYVYEVYGLTGDNCAVSEIAKKYHVSSQAITNATRKVVEKIRRRFYKELSGFRN